MIDEREGRAACLSYARSLLGAKWRHRGRTPWAIDCVGLIIMSLRAAGREVEDTMHYGREPWKDGLQQHLRARFGEPIPDCQWQPGDVALFKAPQRGPGHIGFLADYEFGGFALVHSHVQHDVTEHVLDARWRRLLVEVYSPWET